MPLPLAAQVGQRFNCLAMTLEMPFKDYAEAPEPLQVGRPVDQASFPGAGSFIAASYQLYEFVWTPPSLPAPPQGWSPERSARLGADMLSAVLAVLPHLR